MTAVAAVATCIMKTRRVDDIEEKRDIEDSLEQTLRKY
jgi:hypothetical protein